MTDFITEMQVTLNQKKNNFINWIELNVDDNKVLEAAINYFEYEEEVRKATLRLAEMDLEAAAVMKFENENLKHVILNYNLDRNFNKEKANKWLCEALKLVLIYDYTFTGIKFVRGEEKILKNDILR